MKNIEIKKKYTSLQHLHFDKLKHKCFCHFKNLQTYQDELKKFLIEDSIRSQEMCINTTYMVFDNLDFIYNRKPGTNLQLLGYVTITTDSINLNRRLKDEFQASGINYHTLPALKIARLCVDERYERRNIGTMIVSFCIYRACNLNKEIACRFITLDAKRHTDAKKDSYHFYKKLGFNVIEHKNKTVDELINQKSGVTPMYLDIYHIVKKLGIHTIN